MTDTGHITNPGKDHNHKLRTRLGAFLEGEIYCARWRCQYREIDPNGTEMYFRSEGS